MDKEAYRPPGTQLKCFSHSRSPALFGGAPGDIGGVKESLMQA